ncbi:MAG: ABC transporter permease [Candidatus Kapaibacterium sp.]
MNYWETIISAVTSIRANLLRSVLTLLSIALGTFAIISVGVATSTLENSVVGALDEIGGNSFVIQRTPSIQMGSSSWRKYQRRPIISLMQAEEYKRRMGDEAMVAISDRDFGKTIKCGNFSTNPDVTVFGVDENYFVVRNKNVTAGRPLQAEDVFASRNIVVIGNDVAVKLFPQGNAVGQQVTIDNLRLEVVGVLAAQGAVLGRSQDNEVYIPLNVYVRRFAGESYFTATLSVKSFDEASFASVFDESIGVMRSVRGCKPWDENDFEIEDNSSIKDQFTTFIDFAAYFAAFIASFSLAAAGVGIMNIMLISVKERTREIGLRKAIGAKSSSILLQFLLEAVTLCQLGGIIGLVVGLAIVGIIAVLTSLSFVIPWSWIIISIVFCTFVGLTFGAYPAWKAARLDPIDALRYE